MSTFVDYYVFFFISDDRFILKEMARLEIQPFLEIAPHYFSYIRSCHNSQQATLLVKIMGVYRVKFRNVISNQAFHSNLLVMENLFYARDIIRKFDLKGSVRNRLVNTKSNHEGELVLLDENLINSEYHNFCLTNSGDFFGVIRKVILHH